MSIIREGEKAKVVRDIPSYEKGDIVTVTEVREGDSVVFKYEIDDGEDLVKERVLIPYSCRCGGKKVYSKTKGYVCPWCEV